MKNLYLKKIGFVFLCLLVAPVLTSKPPAEHGHLSDAHLNLHVGFDNLFIAFDNKQFTILVHS